jgi:hypothetical protein
VAVGLIPMEAAGLISQAAARVKLDDADEVVGRIDPLLNRAEDLLEQLKPEGAINTDAVTPELRRYFTLREQVRYLDNAIERFLDWRDREANRPAAPVEASATDLSENRPRRSQLAEALPVSADAWLTMRTPNELKMFLTEHAEDPGEEVLQGRLRRLVASAAWLNLMIEREPRADERALLVLRSVNGRHTSAPTHIVDSCAALFSRRFDLGFEYLDLQQPGAAGIVVSGYLAHDLCAALAGLHLWCSASGLLPLHAIAQQVPAEADPFEVAKQMDDRRREWAEAVARGEASPDDDPLPHGDVLQVHFDEGPVLDVRTGMVSRERPSLSLLSSWLLATFDLPEVLP